MITVEKNTRAVRPSLWLGMAVGFQVLVLVGMVVLSVLPLWTGQSILLRTQPIDPRSMFRGNYVILNYGINRLPNALFDAAERPARGRKVYVLLEPDEQGHYQAARASLHQPDSGVFIKGRIRSRNAPYHVVYGIEALFASPVEAKRLERDFTAGATVEVMLGANGKAALKKVDADALKPG